MRKYFAVALAAAMAFSMTACSVSTTSKTTEATDTPVAAEQETEAVAEEATVAEAEETEAPATDYPNRPINMIIPYAAGGTTDTYGRTLAAQLEKELGQPITVTNQGGASGSIGSQFVRDQASDGYTLLVCAETMGTYRTMGTADLGYNDFTVISPLVGDPKVIVVGKDSKYNTLEELMDDIKANPGKITMSHSGPGGSGHNQGLVLGALGYEVAMTSFDSGNDALLGVVSGQVDFTNPNISTLGSYIESGDVKPLAVFASERLEAYPDVPAFTELYPESEKYLDIPYTVLSFCVNNDTPQEVVDVIKAATDKVLAGEEWNAFATENCADKLYEKYTTADEINGFYERWQSIVCWLQYDNGVAPNSPEEYGIAKLAE